MLEKFGPLNPHTVGLVMKECVRRAMLEIATQRIVFTSEVKHTDYKAGEDLVTSADYAAQKIYLKILDENFPLAGIIAEENFSRKCSDPNHNYYFTVDPLDGTKAYGRKQSHAVSTMIAFVFDGVVEGVTIGDPNTLEIFHSRPGADSVHRIYSFENSQKLIVDTKRSLSSQYLQLRCDPRKLSSLSQNLASAVKGPNLFLDIEVMGGSIGFTFTRLWKGEVGGVLMEKSTGQQTPWDTCPVFGLSKKMGYVFYEIIDSKLVPYTFEPSEDMIKIGNELLCIHESRVEELMEWREVFVNRTY